MKIAPKIKKRRGEGKKRGDRRKRRKGDRQKKRRGDGRRRRRQAAEEEERRWEEEERRWAEEEEEVVRSIFDYSLPSEGEDVLSSEEEGQLPQSDEYVPEKGALDEFEMEK